MPARRIRNSNISRGTLEAARIDWSRPGTPVSTRHGDVYYAASNGLEETRHVFLAGNDLPRAWQRRNRFTIGETGFGTGLNFLASWDLWRRTAPPDARLHFVSLEGFPLTLSDLERAHEPFTELAPLARRLRDAYPHLYGGFHRRHFDDDRVTLTLLFGEAGDMLAALDARMDAWFLDGFSPALNPDLWRPEILNRIGALTRPGGTASSFTVAGAVRRDLQTAGFEVEKAPGFGHKRHMLRARRIAAAPAGPAPSPTYEPAVCVPRSALVIGAGLAGSAVAGALARRQVKVTLIDPDTDLVHAASGNPAGIASPRPTADSSPAGRFHCAAFDYAEGHLFRTDPDVFRPCGVLELAASPQAMRRHEKLATGKILPKSALRALTAEEASQAAGITIPIPALHFPCGGIARPAICSSRLRGSINVTNEQVADLVASEGGWTARLESGEQVSAEIAVLACGMSALKFAAPAIIPMAASRGQLSLVPVTDDSAALAMALSFGAYVSPPMDGFHVLGATYDNVPWPPPAASRATAGSDHWKNHNQLMKVLPDFPAPAPGPAWRARVAFRCTTPDRLPLCGPVPDLQEGAAAQLVAPPSLPTDRETTLPYREGLYICSGLGSRGITTGPILGEMLASLACGDPLPSERVVTDLLHPARFFLRAFRKGGISAQF